MAYKFLPKFLKDFHDQKDVFKLIEYSIIQKREDRYYINYPNWIDAQIYVIDIFLWTMDYYGYRLYKKRSKEPIGNLSKDVEIMRRALNKQFFDAIDSKNETRII